MDESASWREQYDQDKENRALTIDRHSRMQSALTTPEVFLIALALIFTVPYLIWRVGKTDYYAPLVVVQILTGILHNSRARTKSAFGWQKPSHC